MTGLRYDYVSTVNGPNYSTRWAGIPKGTLVNVRSIDDNGIAHVWTINAWGVLFNDTMPFATLKVRES